MTCTNSTFISTEKQQPLWSLASHTLFFVVVFVIIVSSNCPQNIGTPCVYFTSTHFLLFLLPVSYFSLWYLKKVCKSPVSGAVSQHRCPWSHSITPQVFYFSSSSNFFFPLLIFFPIEDSYSAFFLNCIKKFLFFFLTLPPPSHFEWILRYLQASCFPHLLLCVSLP